ncbi:MAG: insulinase family protein, partial [Gemmatimonadetes bacterium]|nr:insulinase family protein [Gemmatimonadota bacterium]
MMEGQANFLAEWEALGDWRWADEYAARMLAATPAEVTEAARRYLDPAQASMMVYRPSSAPVFASGVVEAFAALDNAPTSTLQAIALPTAPSSPALVQGTAPERTHGQVSVFRTARGVPILVRRKAGTPIVHLGLYALGGALDETATHAGIATLLARTTLKGTARRSSDVIALETELLGGSIAPTVTSDGIGWTLSVTPRHLAAGIDLLADVVLTPTCPVAAFETERSVALSQLAQLRDDMMRYPVRLATEAAFGAHPYGRGILGSEETLRAVTVDDALGWHRANVRQSPCVLAVVGDVDPAQIAEVLGSAFASLEYREASPLVYPTWPDGVQQRADTRQVADGARPRLPESLTPRRRCALPRTSSRGVASGLGGRFFDELRDKQSLGYTVHATSSDRLAAGMFLSYIACSPEKEEVARAGLLREFAKLCETPVTDAELARARTYALGTHAIAQQSGGNVLAELVDALDVRDRTGRTRPLRRPAARRHPAIDAAARAGVLRARTTRRRDRARETEGLRRKTRRREDEKRDAGAPDSAPRHTQLVFPSSRLPVFSRRRRVHDLPHEQDRPAQPLAQCEHERAVDAYHRALRERGHTDADRRHRRRLGPHLVHVHEAVLLHERDVQLASHRRGEAREVG